jgi:serine protease AprX
MVATARFPHDAGQYSRIVLWRARTVVTGGRSKLGRLVVGIVAAVTLLLSGAPAGALLLPPPPPPPPVKVIVQQWHASDTTVADLVTALGGTVTRSLPIIGGFAATVPSDAVSTITYLAGVRAVTFDGRVEPESVEADGGPMSVYRKVVDAPTDPGTPQGAGVTVAVIDTGIANVPDLAGNIVPVVGAGGTTTSCVNFSTEPGCADSYGHGTFIAGLIAGNGARKGVAPAAGLLSVKLSGRDGTSSVSQVLAAIQWVVENRDLYHIGVLNLSLRVESNLSYRIDPVNLAVEQAWANDIVVVASAGNQGTVGAETISKPGDDPWIITVGSTVDRGTNGLGDDVIADFSSRGPTYTDGLAKPDVVAPGRSLISVRSPGSAADTTVPTYVDATYRRGSGTSFTAGIVSGAAAVLRSADPTASNDRIKFALKQTARPLAGVDAMAQGSGVVDVAAAMAAPAGEVADQPFHPLFNSLVPGTSADWLGSTWTLAWNGTNWQGTNWQGTNWQGTNWQGTNWQALEWEGTNWQGTNWQTATWQGSHWEGSAWEGTNWQGTNWQGTNWQGTNWQGTNWQGTNWQGTNWQGTNWQSQFWG